mmetsp:Transcript_32150/g.75616  ORF Transcript_32150/g.75616 Transcript_32150/m.75616 type:complete len:242 (+) Transcript_32150:86-811(+)
MAFGLSSAAVAEFASKPFIQNALANPRSELAVRSFFFGIDCAASNAKDLLGGGGIIQNMAPFWYSGHKDYDKLCHAFKGVIREAGRNTLSAEEEWRTTDGRFAQILLCDQLSRNCFRGTEEAFQYDGVALGLAKEMASEALSDGPLTNEIHAMYAFLLILPLLHSECIIDHEFCLELVEWGTLRSPDLPWDMSKKYLLEHTEVLKKFGHYPHRNGKKGRTTTKEEEDWLGSSECPEWAKSQ